MKAFKEKPSRSKTAVSMATFSQEVESNTPSAVRQTSVSTSKVELTRHQQYGRWQSFPQRWSQTRHQQYGNSQSVSPTEVESNTPSAIWQTRSQQYGNSQSVPQMWSQTRHQQYGTVSQCHKGGVKHVISSMATVGQSHRGRIKDVISSMATVSQSVP